MISGPSYFQVAQCDILSKCTLSTGIVQCGLLKKKKKAIYFPIHQQQVICQMLRKESDFLNSVNSTTCE